MHKSQLTKLRDLYLNNDMTAYLKYLNRLYYQKISCTRTIMNDPLNPDFLDFHLGCVAHMISHKKGFIYMIQNTKDTDLFKVGLTKSEPLKRLNQLNNESVVGEFFIINQWAVPHRFFAELEAHKSLKDNLFHGTKEFFQGKRGDIEAQISSTLQKITNFYNSESY